MKYIFIDAETYYRQQDYSLKMMTPVEYLLDQRYQLLGMAVAEGFEDAPYWLEPEEVPGYLAQHRHSKVMFIAHNMLFDGCILSYREGFNPPMMSCTMAITRAVAKQKLGLLPSLARTAAFLGLPPKGKFLAKMSGVTLDQVRANKAFHQEFIDYGLHDVWLCREIFRTWCIATKRFPISEIPILDNVLRAAVVPQFQLDIPVLVEHLAKVKKHKEDLLVAAGVADKSELMSNQKFADMLRRYGVEPPMKISQTTGKETYAFSKQDLGFLALETHEDPDVQTLFAARVGNKTTLEESRTERMITIANLQWPQEEQRWMPMPLRYSAARTHRLGGDWQLNVQNLPRGSDLRKALMATVGHKVIAGDSSQIEARLVAATCGAWNLVAQFESGEDVYASFATLVFSKPIDKVNWPTERFVGKQAVLGLGFGLGWLNFIRRLQIDSKNQTGKMIYLNEAEARHVVNLYRQTYKPVADAWNLLGTQGLYTLVNGGPWTWGPVVFDKGVIHLPNGMSLRYQDMQYGSNSEWTYDTGYEGRKKIYGPKILENVIQSLARIITMEAGVRIRRRIGPWALQAHDELVYIKPAEEAEHARAVILEELKARPNWLPTVPLSAECKIGDTYADAK